MGSDQKPGLIWIYRGWTTTQLHRDHEKNSKDPYEPPRISWRCHVRFFPSLLNVNSGEVHQTSSRTITGIPINHPWFQERSCQGFDRSKRCSQNGGECLMATIPMVESVKNHQLPLRKLTWNLKILPWKRRNYKSLIFGLYVNPGSQPPFKTWWFPLDDDKPFLKKWWFVNQPIKNGGQGLPGFNFEGVNTSRSRGTF